MREPIETIAQLRALIPEPSERAFAKIRDRLCDQGMAFVARARFLALATLGEWGIEISQKGDATGLVEAVDRTTLLIAERPGNQFALGLGNILADPRVALVLMRPGTEEMLRISGRASLWRDDDACARLAAGGKPAVLVIRVEIERAAFHCVRSARRAGLWQPETWDDPQRVSFGRIYAEALASPEIEGMFDQLADEVNAKLY